MDQACFAARSSAGKRTCATPAEGWGTEPTSARRPKRQSAGGAALQPRPKTTFVRQNAPCVGALIPLRTSRVISGFKYRMSFAEEEGSASEPSHLRRPSENATRAGHPRGDAPRRHALAPDAGAPVPGDARAPEEVPAPGGHQLCASRSHLRPGRPSGPIESRELHQG